MGTFTENTRPTEQGVEILMAQAIEDLVAAAGTDAIPPRWFLTAKSVVVLGTALLIELGYFPEQVNTGRSPYPQHKELYDERLKRLLAGLESGDDGIGTPGGEGGPDIAPVWTGLPNPAEQTPAGAVWNPITQSWDTHTEAVTGWTQW